MTKRKTDPRSEWQKVFISDLFSIASEFPKTIRILNSDIVYDKNDAIVPVVLNVEDIQSVPHGLHLNPEEKIFLTVPATYFHPPRVEVAHNRFLGYPHVLQGRRLCIFLDPSREWQPHNGARGFLDQIWKWFSEAAQNAFDSTKALYHAAGGVLHHTSGTPTIVYRESSATGGLNIGYLTERSPHRLDFSWQRSTAALRAPALTLSGDLPVGVASNLSILLEQIDDPNFTDVSGPDKTAPKTSEAFFSSLLTCAIRNPAGSHQYFMLTVPHPNGASPHILAGRLTTPVSNLLRQIVKEHGSVRGLNAEDYNLDVPLEWCYLSDERPEVTTRRDYSRPVSWFHNRNVLVWGCGGLGSWAAEVIARAGTGAITLCDPGIITGGLLVRQNYVEEDIGRTKAEALATRLRKISDSLEVTALPSLLIEPEALSKFDLILDATISHTATVYLDALKSSGFKLPPIGEVATDARTGTLGVMHVTTSSSHATLSQIDSHTEAAVFDDPHLETYQELWQEVSPEAELIPTMGCSVPTFHGSAADLSGVASTLVNVLGRHLQVSRNEVSGTYLISLPHAMSGPDYVFLPYEDASPQEISKKIE